MEAGRSSFARMPPVGIWSLSVGFLALLLLLAGWQIRAGYDRTIRTAEAGLADTARIAEEQLRGNLRVLRLMLRAIAEAPRGDPDALRRFMATRAKVTPEVRQAFIADPNGRVTVATLRALEGRDFSAQPFTAAIRDLPPGRDIHVERPLPIGIDGASVIIVATPLYDPQGGYAGFAAVSLEMGYFLGLLQSVHSGEDGAGALLVSPEGVVMGRDPDAALYIGRNIAGGGAFALHRKAGVAAGTYVHTAQTDGGQKISAVRTLTEPVLPALVVIVGRPLDGVLAPWRSDAAAMSVVMVCVVAAMLALTGLADRRLSALRAQEERYRGLIESQNDLVVRISAQGVLSFVNEAVTRAQERPPEQLLGRPWTEFIHPDDRAVAQQAFAQACLPPAYRATAECRAVNPAGARWILWEGAAIRDAAGTVVELQAVGRDINDWVEQRERQGELLRELDASNRELEQFAYVASHDLREPLRMISSYLGLLGRRYASVLDADGREFLDFARDGARRMDQMVLDLLEFSRVGRLGGEFGPVPLGDVIAAAAGNLKIPLEEAGAELVVAPHLPTVEGSVGELVRLFQNLVGNALKYRSDERPPRIEISVEKSAEGWLCAVADNGIGIAEEYFDRIFDIFQRLHTRDKYEGTGIGLALCRKIVQHHGGRIWVESIPDAGSRFLFTLAAPPSSE